MWANKIDKTAEPRQIKIRRFSPIARFNYLFVHSSLRRVERKSASYIRLRLAEITLSQEITTGLWIIMP